MATVGVIEAKVEFPPEPILVTMYLADRQSPSSLSSLATQPILFLYGLTCTVIIQARAQPVVAIMSTGDELAEPDHRGPLAPGVIRDSNRAMLIAACEAEGARVIDLGIARDEAGSIEDLLDQAIAQGADLLVTSGGVSMGDRDLVKPLLEKRGKIHFGR